jgi:phage terminase large subunit
MQHREIEGIKDKELWKVYARGLTGNVKGLIYPDWVMVDSIEWNDPFFAIDFGFTNDPTAIVKIEKIREKIYIEELAYKIGSMTARVIADVLWANGYDDNSVVYCEHEPNMIKQLKMLEIRAVAAKKGAGSLNAGIEKMKEYEVYYIGNNIKKEREKYIWEVNELGNATNKPIDAFNHALDAARYGVYTHFYRA